MASGTKSHPIEAGFIETGKITRSFTRRRFASENTVLHYKHNENLLHLSTPFFLISFLTVIRRHLSFHCFSACTGRLQSTRTRLNAEFAPVQYIL